MLDEPNDLSRPKGRLVVVSPHSDDAILSLGAALSAATRSGASVHVLTVLAGDPDSTVPASAWDRRTGFRTHGEAARARRVEDSIACARIGASVEWLPFGYGAYGRTVADERVWATVRDVCAGADTVLVPGYPLAHPDHEWLAGLLLNRGLSCGRIGVYVEQPYAYNRRRLAPTPALTEVLESLVGDVTWTRLPASAHDRVAKWRAVRAYRSQLRALGLSLERARLERVLLHEQRGGGETVAWL